MKKIELRCKTKTAVNGGKFISYFAIIKTGGTKPVKFTKDVINRPNSACTLLIEDKNVWLGKDRNGYECFWIKKIEKIENVERATSDVSQYFDDVDEEASKLPF